MPFHKRHAKIQVEHPNPNKTNVFCCQNKDIIQIICKHLDLPSINKLYATCKHMQSHLETFKHLPNTYVNQNPLWLLDLYLSFGRTANSVSTRVIENRLKYYNKKSPHYYNNITKFGYERIPLSDVSCSISGTHIMVQQRIADEQFDINFYDFSKSKRLKVVPMESNIRSCAKVLPGTTIICQLHEKELYVDKKGKFITVLADPFDIVAFDFNDGALVYLTGNGAVYQCPNFAKCSKFKNLYHKKHINSESLAYGQYQKTKKIVPNPDYIKHLINLPVNSGYLAINNSYSGSVYSITQLSIHESYLMICLGRYICIYSLTTQKCILTLFLRQISSICRNVIITDELSKSWKTVIKTQSFCVEQNKLVECGKLKTEFVSYAMDPSNQNVVVCGKDGFIRIYDVRLNYLKTIGKRLYKTDGCKLIISSESRILTLEKDEVGVCILIRHV